MASMAELREIAKGKSPERDASFLDHPERLRSIKELFGFYPHSSEEATRVEQIVRRSDRQFPTLTYLDETFARNHQAKRNAPAALSAIVSGFESYIGNSVDEISHMDLFLDRLRDWNEDDQTGFNTSFPRNEWQNDGTLRATFTSMTRFLETDAFVETGQGDKAGKQSRIEATSGDERLDRISESLGVMRLGHLKGIARSVIDEQEHRQAFWLPHLQESTRHFAVRDQANQALQSLKDL